ncbi:hypothetical protein HK102_007230, partial [Quaeritorhiza haematococci]
YVHIHRNAIKTLEEFVNEVTKRVEEAKTRLAGLELQQNADLEESKAKTREHFKEFGKQTKDTECTLSEYIMTKEDEISKANAEIEGRKKILEEVKLFRDQFWEMWFEDPEAPLPPIPDFDRLCQPHRPRPHEATPTTSDEGLSPQAGFVSVHPL